MLSLRPFSVPVTPAATSSMSFRCVRAKATVANHALRKARTALGLLSIRSLRAKITYIWKSGMRSPERTPRQRIIELITGTRLSSRQLAQLLGISERQVEDHLTHVVKTLAR